MFGVMFDNEWFSLKVVTAPAHVKVLHAHHLAAPLSILLDSLMCQNAGLPLCFQLA